MRNILRLSLGVALCWGCFAGTGLPAGDTPADINYEAHDTLKPGTEDSADARACLENLVWKPGEFMVSIERQAGDGPDAILRFPSPAPSGDATNDLVAMEWYAPKRENGEFEKSPAIVIVHESNPRMEVGRLAAKAMYAKGFHAFLIQLPTYGLRRVKDAKPPDGGQILLLMKQAMADVRRARDAVAALPEIDSNLIALQGTSLGGFVAATTAGLDHGYDQVFIMMAGGNLMKVFESGQRDAAQLREKLKAAGYTREKLQELTSAIEPLRLAHRLDPQSTWMYSGLKDQVVPPECALALQHAAHLPDDHHIRLWGDHYRTALYFPVIVDHMAAQMRAFDRTQTIPPE